MNRYSFSKIRKSSRRSFDASCELQVADMSVLVTRKSMKSIRLKVTPLGEVRVSAPYNVSDDEIRHMVNRALSGFIHNNKRLRTLLSQKLNAQLKKNKRLGVLS